MGNQDGGSNKQSSKRDERSSNDRSRKNSLEVWCICRIVKPCTCEKRKDEERDTTPTPREDETRPEGDESDRSTPTADATEQDETDGKCKKCVNSKCFSEKSGNSVHEENELNKNVSHSNSFEEKSKAEIIREFDECIAKIHTLTDVECQSGDNKIRTLAKTSLEKDVGNERLDNEKENDKEQKILKETKDTEKGVVTEVDLEMDQAKLDSISLSSFDHMDFDASFCSLKSTDTMEQGDLADQLSLVQQMVMEMKQGFSTAMEELSKIQYGDQNLQQQLADNKKECSEEVNLVKDAVDELKIQVQTLSGQIERVTDAQRTLQEKIDSYQTDKEILLEELEKYGLITDQLRLRLTGGEILENNNNNLPDVAPMVHPYLNSIQNHANHRGAEDQYNEDASLTAAVTRSLSLTQALGEKCLHIDASTASSDDEDNSRHSHSHSGSGHKPPVKRHGSFNYEDGGRNSQKIPPHEQVLEEVHREEAARDIVDAEREYCTQIWSLVDNFMNPLREEEIVSLRECNLLFPAYIPLIYEQHCIMLRKLEERMRKWKFSGVIGDIFAKLTDSQDGDGLMLYQAYINDFPAIINSMNKWFAQSPQFCDVMQCHCLANSPVLPLLLAPLQQVPKYSLLLKSQVEHVRICMLAPLRQIPKYTLLLKNLLKYTPSDHPDRYYLDSSLYKLKAFLNTMNDDLEHAMNVLHINRDGVSRSRDSGNSVRSRSSGSSTEVNHMSSTRDSGVHSSGEEQSKSPMSPNTTRRFVLQVLRERREKGGSHSPIKTDHHPSTPRGHAHPPYGSHPDLTYNLQGYTDGRTSPYLATLPQTKLFSSLSKLPLPHERGKKVRVTQKHDVHKPGINTNYLRPLTPQIFPTSTSAHSFDTMRKREENAERARLRPSSAIEISSDGTERLERYHDLLAYRAASPTRHSVSTGSSDRSRKDMQMSLHKLLLETGNGTDETINSEQERDVNESSYHKQFLATKDRIMRRGSGKDRGNAPDGSNITSKRHSHGQTRGQSLNTGDDYGIYGEYDDFDNAVTNDVVNEEAVKPMQLLPDSHRPKIMVPKWRQNAPLQPPNYNTSVEKLQKHNGYSSEENLAASLAQSLMDGTVASSERNIDNRKNASNTLPRKNVKRKEPSGRRSPRSVQHAPLSVHPTHEDNTFVPHQPVEQKNTSEFADCGEFSVNQTITASVDNVKGVEIKGRRGSGVTTALTDVIAYTADCLERSDSNKATSDNSDSSEESKSVAEHSAIKQDRTALPESSDHVNDSLDTPNVPSSSVSETSVIQSSSVKSDSNTTVIQPDENPFVTMSPSYSPEKNTPLDTDKLVYYFQNRNNKSQSDRQTDGNKANDRTLDSNGGVPNFVNMNSTSTPTSEAKSFNPELYNAKNNVGRKDRLVRADESVDVNVKSAGKHNAKDTPPSLQPEKNINVSNDNIDDFANKERVLRAVDRLRMSFERPKTLDISSSKNPTRNITRPASTDSSPQKMPLVLKTFALPQKETYKDNKKVDHSVNAAGNENTENIPGTSVETENTHRMYRKAGGLKSPTRHLGEATATARQIQKLERSTSPTGRTIYTHNTDNTKNVKSSDASPAYVQNSQVREKKGTGLHRMPNDGSYIPQRSGSPVRSISRPLSAEASIDPLFMQNGDNSQIPIKSAMKDTKIPVLRKSGGASGTNQLSKSTEDISKMKKKSAFKDSLKNIFSRKKKKSRSSNNENDLDTILADMQLSFQDTDDWFSFPLTRERSHSTSQILQNYKFEEDDDDPVSIV